MPSGLGPVRHRIYGARPKGHPVSKPKKCPRGWRPWDIGTHENLGYPPEFSTERCSWDYCHGLPGNQPQYNAISGVSGAFFDKAVDGTFTGAARRGAARRHGMPAGTPPLLTALSPARPSGAPLAGTGCRRARRRCLDAHPWPGPSSPTQIRTPAAAVPGGEWMSSDFGGPELSVRFPDGTRPVTGPRPKGAVQPP